MLKYSREEKYTKPQNISDMLKLALKRERASIRFYDNMLKHDMPGEIKRVIEKLRDEESGHIKSIEFKIKELEGRI